MVVTGLVVTWIRAVLAHRLISCNIVIHTSVTGDGHMVTWSVTGRSDMIEMIHLNLSMFCPRNGWNHVWQSSLKVRWWFLYKYYMLVMIEQWWIVYTIHVIHTSQYSVLSHSSSWLCWTIQDVQFFVSVSWRYICSIIYIYVRICQYEI